MICWISVPLASIRVNVTTHAVQRMAEDVSLDEPVDAVTPHVCSCDSPAHSSVTINELLAYVSHYRNKSNVDALRRTLCTFFSAGDIGLAKKVLIQKFKSHLGTCLLTAERRNLSTRTAHEAEIDDILGMFDFLDTTKAFGNHLFAARNLDNLPKFGPEEMNLAAIVDRQVHMEVSIQNVSAAVEQ
jgi:hypothetical protein